MNTPHRALWAATAALLLVGAAPTAEIEDLLRRGSDAFARKDYPRALALWSEAEERARDPGLVAFNKAAALYRLKEFEKAEQAYRSCLDDAEMPAARRARALYDLGTSLIHVAGDRDSRKLEEAIRRLRACRDLTDNALLKAQALHNLELARLLWVKAKANPDDRGRKPEPETDDPARKKPEDDPGREPGDRMGEKGAPSGKGQTLLQDPSKGQQKAIETKETMPGKGNLQPLPDTDELSPLTARDTAEHLERAAKRIQRDQREHLRGWPRTVPNVKDW